MARVLGRVTAYTAYGLLAAGLGALAGAGWWALVDLPVYAVGTDGRAAFGERELAGVIRADAWFTVLGLGVGVGLGLVAWRRFRRLGWPLVALVVGAALAAGLVCWGVGHQLGPGPLAPRLAAARPGDLVPIELTVRAWAALLVWPFGAVLPVLLGSSLGHEDE